MDISVKVGVIIQNSQGEVLLIKEKLDKHNEPRWNIVKGTYGDHPGETVFQAAERECMEEASVSVNLISALGTYVSEEAAKVRVQFNFIAEIYDGEPAIAKISDQENRNESILEVRWFSTAELQVLENRDFVSNRIYSVVSNYLNGERYDLGIYKQVHM
jgi:ADP-ribose pyrophosphatase YjhB (NUDIX family)